MLRAGCCAHPTRVCALRGCAPHPTQCAPPTGFARHSTSRFARHRCSTTVLFSSPGGAAGVKPRHPPHAGNALRVTPHRASRAALAPAPSALHAVCCSAWDAPRMLRTSYTSMCASRVRSASHAVRSAHCVGCGAHAALAPAPAPHGRCAPGNALRAGWAQLLVATFVRTGCSGHCSTTS